MDLIDERFMAQALELAGSVPCASPNPRVGAVLVLDGRVVGTGAHRGAGHPHAEAEALRDADAAGATAYVNLEPCTHHGRTPPCAPALVDAGVARVVCGMEDPDPRVAGAGVRYLQSHGVDVVVGVLADRARMLNAAFIHQRTTRRPLVTVKLALSLDGRLAARDGSSRWITGESTRRRVHRRRVEVDGVMVGAGTVLADDPALSARDVEAPRQPARVVLDSSGRVPAGARVFAPGAEVIVLTTDRAAHERQMGWKERGAEVIALPAGERGVDLDAAIGCLARRGWLELYCEGGAELATALLAEGLADRLELYYGPVLVGEGPSIGDLGIDSFHRARRWSLAATERLGDDVLVELLKGTH